jgi:hypothetical protein
MLSQAFSSTRSELHEGNNEELSVLGNFNIDAEANKDLKAALKAEFKWSNVKVVAGRQEENFSIVAYYLGEIESYAPLAARM